MVHCIIYTVKFDFQSCTESFTITIHSAYDWPTALSDPEFIVPVTTQSVVKFESLKSAQTFSQRSH
jgi:hypothetical protein